MGKTIFTRKEVYELVWKQPLTQLSKILQVEPQRVKEICIENKIPLPTKGYWSKVRFNKKVDKTPLPELEKGNVEINLKTRKFRTAYHKQAFELGQRKDLNFKVPRRISTYHPLVRTSKKLLEDIDNSKDNFKFFKVSQERDLLPIHTDAKLRSRALLFMDTLIHVAEAMGGSIEFYCNKAHVQLFGQKTEINLRQKVYRIRTKDETGWGRESWEKSEKLEFQAGPSFDQKSWIDNTKRKIEECLPEIIAWIEMKCQYWHDVRAKQAIEENRRLLEQNKQEALKAAQDEEKAKVNQLLSDSKNWEKAELMKRYIDEMEKQIEAEPENRMNLKSKDYITWARKVALELNPLNKGDCLK